MSELTTTSFLRRKMIVHDEAGRFVELSGWDWHITRDAQGNTVNQWEGPAYVLTTNEAEAVKMLGPDLVAASEAVAFETAAREGADFLRGKAEEDLETERAEKQRWFDACQEALARNNALRAELDARSNAEVA